uniref:Adhesion G protein-coupled receptor F7 n=1 Tax=Myripristis murdjan TaxID=586833 RepID=A0A667Y598_9TELE
SPANIGAIVKILEQVANVSRSSPINENQITSSHILNSSAQRSASLEPLSASSALLLSLETVSNALSNDSFEIATPLILLNKTAITGSFSADLNSSVVIDVSVPGDPSSTITTITFASMDNVLPARNASNSTINTINGNVVLVNFKGSINNVSFSFDIINETLGNPQCVFWNFSLFNGLGGWDDEGCELVSNANETVTCNCNHLTSFSILMSAFIPKEIQAILAYITYIGVGISLGCLVICLIIEAIIWRKVCNNNTLRLYHVSIVNIAVCLLIADIWFIIAAAISSPNVENPPACRAATFFIHFFYLALFFWMLASALFVLYYSVHVFDGVVSEHAMAIGFSLGYGAPLIIAIITIAVTAPNNQYVQRTGVCWLNWDESKALLAFVIPALLIVVVNLFILVVVMCKIFSSRGTGNATSAHQNHVLLSIARNLVVLTPLFGTTWCLGIGTMINAGPPLFEIIHYSFTILNSFQVF